LTRLRQEGDDQIVDANKKVPEDETTLSKADVTERKFTPDERFEAAKKIDYIMERDESSVESIGSHGYMPGIIDIQCNLTALEAERDALKAERDAICELVGMNGKAPKVFTEALRRAEKAEIELSTLKSQLEAVIGQETAREAWEEGFDSGTVSANNKSLTSSYPLSAS
jgi:hypothetical protein